MGSMTCLTATKKYEKLGRHIHIYTSTQRMRCFFGEAVSTAYHTHVVVQMSACYPMLTVTMTGLPNGRTSLRAAPESVRERETGQVEKTLEQTCAWWQEAEILELRK